MNESPTFEYRRGGHLQYLGVHPRRTHSSPMAPDLEVGQVHPSNSLVANPCAPRVKALSPTMLELWGKHSRLTLFMGAENGASPALGGQLAGSAAARTPLLTMLNILKDR